MNELPKIVRHRLQAAQPGQAHPDADLLTAFAEEALSATERDGVLKHLALCGECREIITLSLPDAEVVTASIADATYASRATVPRVPASNKRSSAWLTLGWAALAAGFVVAASVLVTRPGKLNQPTPPTVSQQVATVAQPVSGTETQIASSPAAPIIQSASPAGTVETPPRSELHLSKTLEAPVPSRPVGPGMLLAGNKPAGNKKGSAQEAKLPGEPPEAGEVSSAAPDRPATSFQGNLMARNEGPPIENAKIEKAKPALPAMQTMDANVQHTTEEAVTPMPAPSRARTATSTSAPRLARPLAAGQSLVPHVTWAISAGVLQRSKDSGQTWQSALSPDHPLLCYAAHGADIWTGGQAGTLFHSADGGVTWAPVQPAVKGQQLSADVTNIDIANDVDVSSPVKIIVSTNNKETWLTTDSGKTWDKR